MESYDARMARIVKEDNARRFLRDYDAEASGISTDSDSYLHSRNITGVPSPANRTYKATKDGNRRERTFGLLIHEGKELRTDAVIVRHGDSVGIVPQSHFRKARTPAQLHAEDKEMRNSKVLRAGEAWRS